MQPVTVYTTEGPWASIAPAFIEGSGAQSFPASGRIRPGVAVVWGLLRGSPQIIYEAKKNGQPWIYLDHGYFRRGHFGGHYRVTWNAFQQNWIEEVPSDRWESLNVTLEPWQRNGTHILVCPPTDHVCKVFGCAGWEKKTLEQLKTLTDRPIRIRRKTDPEPFHKALVGAHCVVSLNSHAAVESIVHGVPVFVGPESAASPVGLTELWRIEEPIYPDREKWAHSLAYGQFNISEMRNGTAWRNLSR